MMEEPSLFYLLAHPAALGIAVLRPALLVLLAGVALFWVRPAALGAPAARIASAVRTGAFVCVVLALAGVELTTRVPSDRLTVVALVDQSASIDADGRAWTLRYLNELQSSLAPGDELAILSFAGDVALHRSPAAPAPITALPEPPVPAATDLQRAVDSGMALLPADGQRRLLLISDGNETRGDSRRQLPWLRSASVRVDAVVPPRRHDADVRVERVVAPASVGEGNPLAVRVVAHNSGQVRPAVLNLYVDDTVADSAAVELQPGRNALALPTFLTGKGSRRLRAELTLEQDAIAANNSAETGITVGDRARVLVISGRERSPIARALARKGLAPATLPAAGLRSVEMLLPYHLVVLEDVPAATLSRDGSEALERYVSELGGGLLFVGGGETFGDPGYGKTALRRMLPVTLEPHRPKPGAREPLALFLVVDRSNSMGYNSRVGTLRDGEKLRYAKEAALAVIGQLKDEDLAGVIAFDSQPHEIAPLRALKENRRVLKDLIPRLVENGGTDFYDALVAARTQLAASRLTRRHIMLLTDGDTNRAAPDEYRALVKDLANDKISVTTVRVGDNTVNLKLLRDISAETGGEFHYVEDAKALPDLMLRETTRAIGPSEHGTERYLPELAGRNQLLQGIDEQRLPSLSGYAYAKPKSGADVLLQVARMDRHDPLLAVWQYGLGRVAAYTASPSGDGSEWLAWPEFSKFWAQLAQWTAREHSDDEVAIDARRTDGAVELTVRPYGPTADGAVFVASLRIDDETTRDIDLVPRQPRLFTATLLDLPAGRYPLTLIKRGAGGAVSQQTQMVSIPATDAGEQAEFERSEPNRSLLTQLTSATGGLLDAPARAIAAREPGTRRVGYPLDFVFLPLAMLLFLADVAVRKLWR